MLQVFVYVLSRTATSTVLMWLSVLFRRRVTFPTGQTLQWVDPEVDGIKVHNSKFKGLAAWKAVAARI